MYLFNIALIVIISALSLSGADLEFETKEYRISPSLEKSEENIDFKFTCAAKVPVTIGRISSACSCIEASADKAVYNPGETGVVHVNFKFMESTGIQKKKFRVLTRVPNRKDEEEAVFTIEGKIPSVFQFAKKIAVWTAGSENIKQELVMSVKDEFNLTDVKIIKPDEYKHVSISCVYNEQMKKIVFTAGVDTTNLIELTGKESGSFQAEFKFQYKIMPLNVMKTDIIWVVVYRPLVSGNVTVEKPK